MIDCNAIVIVALSMALGLAFALLTRKIASEKKHGLDSNHGVPRVGGLAIIGTVAVMSWAAIEINLTIASAFAGSLLVALIGLLDDIGLGRGPNQKLLGSLLASGLTLSETGVYVAHLSTPVLSQLFAFTPFALVLSIVGLAGMSHAVNLIDGIHGLALSFSIIAFTSLGFIAMSIDETSIEYLAFTIVGACLGMLVLNFPSGSIFLGDAGSYFLGFMAAWMSIYLCYHNSEVSPWAMFCIFVYPIVDVGYAVVRRLRRQKNPLRGDKQHLHHRLFRLSQNMPHNNQYKMIIVTTTFCAMLALAPAVFATINFATPKLLIANAGISVAVLVSANLLVSIVSSENT